MGLGSIAMSVLGSAVPGVPGDMGRLVEWGPSPIAPRQWESLGLEVLMGHPQGMASPLGVLRAQAWSAAFWLLVVEGTCYFLP